VIAALPAPNAPVPHAATALVRTLTAVEHQLDSAIVRWDTAKPPPRDVTLLALYEERAIRALAADRALAKAVFRRDPGVRDDVTALKELGELTGPVAGSPRIRTGPAVPAKQLLAWYREAQSRFGIRWQLLAAINFVESAFGKVRNSSSAGAQGPMQFEPATWRAYGLGGHIHDPHDAILGAANYLAANDGAHDERRAVLRYNPSALYEDAVLRYANRIARDPRAFLVYYSWQVYVRAGSGERRVTGPR
jgi:membrane-bound lytic murein transglycosylase B